MRSASQYGNPDNNLGYGIPNFTSAYFGEILSVESEENTTWKIFPNPLISGDLTISTEGGSEIDLTVFDVAGRMVLEKKMERSSPKEPYTIQLNQLHPGVYILQIRDGNEIKRAKLLKK